MWYFTPLLGWAPAAAAGSKTFTCNITENQTVSAALGGRARGFAATIAETEVLFPTRPNNYLYYSEEFDNALWVKNQLSVAANTGDTTDPLGTNTAEKLTDNATSASHTLSQIGGLANASQSFTVYLKAGTRTSAAIKVRCSSDNRYHTLNLSTGASTGSGGTTGTYITTSSVTSSSIGSGWYRYKVSVTFETAGAALFPTWEIIFANTAYSGSATSFYAWGAQVSQGSSLPTYEKTTNNIANSPHLSRTRGVLSSIIETGTKFYTVGMYGVNISNQEFTSTVTQTVGGNVDWTNVTNARVDDGNYASVTLPAISFPEIIMFSLADFGISSGLTITSMSCKVRVRCTRNDNSHALFLYDPVGDTGTTSSDYFNVSTANTWEVIDVNMTDILTEIGYNTSAFTTYPKLAYSTNNFGSASTTDIDYIKFTITTAGSLGPEGIATNRTRTYTYNIAETNGYTINLDKIYPFKELIFDIIETNGNSISLYRTRRETTTITENLTITNIPFLRTRNNGGFTVNEVESLTNVMVRMRGSTLGIIETQTDLFSSLTRSRVNVSTITEVEGVSPTLKITRTFGNSISEVVGYNNSINRNRPVSLSNTMQEQINNTLKRERTLLPGNIIETETMTNTLKRDRKFIFSLVEQIVHSIDFSKYTIKDLDFTISEVEAITTNFVRNKKIILTVAETEQINTAVLKVLRSYVGIINQGLSHNNTRLSRTRNMGSLSIAQVENILVALHRLRQATLDIAEAYSLDIELLKMKLLQCSINENSVIDINSLNRSRGLINVFSETVGLVGNVIRNRKITPTIDEVETIASSIQLVHSLIFTINETQVVNNNFIRNRQITSIITELENLSFTLGKIKLLNMAITENQGYYVFINRLRNNNLNLAQLYDLYFNMQRGREFIIPVEEGNDFNLNVGRIREEVMNIIENENVHDIAINRIRDITTLIEETTGFNISIDVNRDNPGELVITISYNTWEGSESSSSYNLTPKTYTFNVPLISSGDIMFNENFQSTIHSIIEDVVDLIEINDVISGTTVIEI